jgi:hypothetical protein
MLTLTILLAYEIYGFSFIYLLIPLRAVPTSELELDMETMPNSQELVNLI